MKQWLLTLSLVAFVGLAAQFSKADITYVDATLTNTTGATIPESAGGAAADAGWKSRTDFANGSQVIAAHDTNDNGSETTPELTTTFTGLAAGKYDVYAYLWSANNANWDVQVGLTSGSLTAYDRLGAGGSTQGTDISGLDTDADGFANSGFSNPVLVQEGNRNLYQLSLGTTVVDGTGSISVFINDLPNNGHRTWYDGLGYDIFVPDPTIEINRDTGAMTFVNPVGAPSLSILGYSMTSAAGALNPSLWTSIAGNWDKVPSGDGSVDPDDAWTRFTNPASRTDLSEGELDANGAHNGATITAGQDIDLGNAWIRYPTEDVQIELLLDDGSKTNIDVMYVGNGDAPFLAGDFNFDNDVDDDDYVTLRDGLHTDLSALSGAEAYPFGDMNGDSANNYTDTLLFRTAYDDFNGAGAFDAMVAGVPEPTSLALLGLGGAALLFLRRGRSRAGDNSTLGGNKSMRMFHRTLLGMTMLSTLVLLFSGTHAVADPLLIDFNSTTQDGDAHPQAGYQSYDAGHEVAEDFVPVGYSAFGTTVTLTPTWPDTTDNRVMQMIDRNSNGPPVTGNDANYLGDMLDLVTDWIGADSRPQNGGNGTASPTTLELTLSGIPAGDYYYRAYHHDTEFMNPEFTISLTDADGTASIGTFEVTGSSPRNTNPNPVPGVPGFGPAILSSTVDFPFRSDGGDVVFQYQVTEGANVHEAFVVVNGIEIWDEPIPASVLTLEVNTDTGATRILNTTGREIDINYYEITSASGSLNPTGWNSLDTQDFDAIGPDVGDNWDEAGGSDEETLSEIYFHGSSNVADEAILGLGNAFDRVEGQEDIAFSFGLTAGAMLQGIVDYVTGGIVEDGDFDGSGAVTQGDLDLVLLNWGQTAPIPGWVNQIPVGNVGDTQLDLVRTNWGNTYSSAAATSAVPEPTSLGLLGLAIAGLALGCIRRPRN